MSTSNFAPSTAIQWYDDDGVYVPMISDTTRNQFYDRLIATHVAGKRCLDIGFGTGILSLLCIKYGAESVVAFEVNPERYLLGKKVIDELGLNHLIDLRNQKYRANLLDDPDLLLIHELVGHEIWNQGLFDLYGSRQQILPGN